MATQTNNSEILDKTFQTSDGRLLFVKYDSFSNIDTLIIVLGNTVREPFKGKDWDKIKQACTHRLKWFIKELDAKEINE